MWHNEIRSFAPRILPYERAVLANAVAPASKADLVKNFLRSMVSSGALMLVLPYGSVPNAPAAPQLCQNHWPRAGAQIAVERPRAVEKKSPSLDPRNGFWVSGRQTK